MASSKLAMDKQTLVSEITAQLEHDLLELQKAARAAHEAATHEESRAEDAHDTRGLEASYLAGAQAARAAEIERQIAIFKYLKVRTFLPSDSIQPGALARLEHQGRSALYFLVPESGGLTLRQEPPVHVVSIQSPLGEALLGLKQGAIAEVESGHTTREYEVLEIL